MRKWVMSSLLLALVAALGSVGALAQTDDMPLPPQIIDVWPLPGVEAAPDEPLTITFDQPMDPDAVQAAITFEPEISGAFAWADARTLTFSPETGWPRGASYTVTIAPTAAAQTGVPLAGPYRFDLVTLGALNVAEIAPSDGATEVAINSRIVVSFDRPVVPLMATDQQADLPAPIRIEPAVQGVGEWVNTSIYQLTPALPLAGSTVYTVTVPAGLVAADGATLDQTVTWTFATQPPQILSVDLAGRERVMPDETVTVTFSQAMDHEATEKAFILSGDGGIVSGAFSWSPDDTQMTFTPAEPLALETRYTVEVLARARAATGQGMLTAPYRVEFTTVPLPGIEDTNPDNGLTTVNPENLFVSIGFRSPMNMETLRDRIIILPEPEEWESVIWSSQSLNLRFPLTENTRYTITLLAGAEDVLGNAIPHDYTFTFSTGSLRDRAYPVINGDFMVTGAQREDTRLGVMVTGTPTVDFSLYRVDERAVARERYGSYLDYSYYRDPEEMLFLGEAGDLVRSWSLSFDSQGQVNVPREVLLASEEGGSLPIGLYWLEIIAPRMNWDNTYISTVLAVSTANLTVKRTPEETLVWVTDMVTGQPVADVEVTIWQAGDRLALGRTDASGVFRAPVDLREDGAGSGEWRYETGSREEFILITAQAEGVFGAWYSSSEASLPTSRGYLYTDRPIYRPGEPVYFRGVLRDRRDMDFSVPNRRSVSVEVALAWGGEPPVFAEDVAVTDFGTFSGEFTLPLDVALGDYHIRVGWGAGAFTNRLCWDPGDGSEPYCESYADDGITFTVAEFRVPEYEVTLTPQQTEIIAGDPLNVLVAANFYAGGAVSGAALNGFIQRTPAGFSYEGDGRYVFSDFRWQEYPRQPLTEAVTNPAGLYLITSADTGLDELPIQPYSLRVQANVSDQSGQFISARTQVLVHPAAVYVGLGAEERFGSMGQPLTVNLITVTPESVPLPNQTVTLDVVERRWERVPVEGRFGRSTWEQIEIPVETLTVTTGADGKAVYTFNPPNGGVFDIRAQVIDSEGRANRSRINLWVFQPGRSIWWSQPGESVSFVTDQDAYKPGDTARILIANPFEGPATALITVERADVMRVEVIAIEGTTLTYDLPIEAGYAPTAYFTVTIMRGTTADDPNPAYASGTKALVVEPVDRLLTVEVTPSERSVEPGDTLTFDVRVLDADGDPVQAEVGLALTDEAVLALLPPNSGSLRGTFYDWQRDYVRESWSMTGLLDLLTDGVLPGGGMGGGGGGGGGFGAINLRENFVFTPLWSPHVVTDAEGRATVSMAMPDNLTRWKVDARVVSLDTKVGQYATTVVSTLPLRVRPVAPRFFVVGDRVQLAALVDNFTDDTQTVQTLLEATGVELLSQAEQPVTIEPGGSARIVWEAVVQDVAGVDLTFYALGADGAQDAAKPTLRTGPDDTIPVYRYTAPDTVGTGGLLTEAGAAVEAVSLPPRLDASQGTLTVRLDPSLAVTVTDSFDYLSNFPHQCVEQTVSRFLPNVVTYRALRGLDIADPVLEANLVTEIEFALAYLGASQNSDGGWGWFPGLDSSPIVSAYALLGLAEAQAAGFDISPVSRGAGRLDYVRARQYVTGELFAVGVDTPPWQLNLQAFMLYALARADAGNRALYDALFEQRLEMTYGARAYLLMAYHARFPDAPAVDALVSDLTTAALLSATGAHWEEPFLDWVNWSSDTRTTALALAALTRVQPDHPLLPNAVRWLLVARQGDHWSTTQETVWALIAFTDWMLSTGELQGSYDFSLRLNAAELAVGQVTPDSVREGAVLRIAVGDLLRDQANRLVIARGAGAGALYYTAHLDLRLPAAEVDAISRGISVNREYFGPDGVTRVTQAHVGDIITVRLTLNLPQDIYYVVLEDPLPAGLESINPDLLVSAGQAEGPTLAQPGYDDAYWYWGWWWFDRTELRDEQTVLYADFLPDGTYVYTYQARATVPGIFQTMPSQAYAFYFPEVLGRTDGLVFTVLPAER